MAIGSHLLDRLSGCLWAIRPESLQAFESVLSSKFIDGLSADTIKALALNSMDSKPTKKYTEINIPDNKSVICIEGKLMNQIGYMDSICGMSSISDYEKQVIAAREDKSIDHIILDMDSPGGTVMGSFRFADLVYETRKYKRISTICTGEMCSAAMLIGTAADEVFASSDVDPMGSIGVVMMHVDQSQKDAKDGLKYTYVHAGKYKVLGNPHADMSSDDLKEAQKSVDYTYGLFVEAVARNRGLSKDDVLKYAEGRIFHAKELLGSGLIDGICTLEDLLND